MTTSNDLPIVVHSLCSIHYREGLGTAVTGARSCAALTELALNGTLDALLGTYSSRGKVNQKKYGISAPIGPQPRGTFCGLYR